MPYLTCEIIFYHMIHNNWRNDTLEEGDTSTLQEAGTQQPTTTRTIWSSAWAGLLIVIFALALSLSLSAHQYERFPGDLPIAKWVQSISLPLFSGAMEVISKLGNWTWATVATGTAIILLFLVKRRVDVIYLLVITVASTAINPLIKEAVGRPRPSSDLVDVKTEVSSASFPSGHVMYAIAFYGFILCYTYACALRPRWLRWTLQVIVVVLILSMGLSRVYLGVHWPSDVIGAYAFGVIFLVGFLWLRGRQVRMETSTAKPWLFGNS